MLFLKSQANPYNEHGWGGKWLEAGTHYSNSFPWPNSRNLSHFSRQPIIHDINFLSGYLAGYFLIKQWCLIAFH